MTLTPIISLHQPFAAALFTESRAVPGRMIKEHETRSRRYPTKYDGVIVGIHAAKKAFRLRDIGDTGAFRVLSEYGLMPNLLTYGAVIGTARLSGCWEASERWSVATQTDRTLGHWAPGRFVWRLTEATLLPQAIPMKGFQGWWRADLGLDA